MVRKIIKIIICVIVCCACLSSTTNAINFTVYEGNFSNTYVTYFRDILSNCSLLENYVCFRSGQYEYTMIVGDIQFQNDEFLILDTATSYTINTYTSYNSTNTYTVSEIGASRVQNKNNYILYSNLGNYPQLESRVDKIEILQQITIIIAMLCFVIRSIFYYRKRR